MDIFIKLNPVALWLCIPILISVSLAIYVFARPTVLGSRVFAFFMLAICEWSVFYGVELSCLNLEGMLISLVMEVLGVVTVSVLWLIVTLLYTGREKWVTRRTVVLLFVIPSITIVIAATNQLHHLYYSAVNVDTSGPFPMLALTWGPWLWVSTIYLYALILTSILLLIEQLSKPGTFYRNQVIAMLVGISVPWTVIILYVIFGLMPLGHLNLTPFAFTVTGVVFAWSMFRHGLFNIVPIAYDAVIDSIDDAVAVLDRQNRIVGYNKAAHKILKLSRTNIGQAAAIGLKDWPELSELDRYTRLEILSEWQDSTRCYEASSFNVADRNKHVIGKVIFLRDVTERKQMEQKLKEMATHDFLTGLPNRVLLTDRFTIVAAQAHRNRARIAVMSLDLDKFKTINDTLGHEAGDQVLKFVSKRLTAIIRASDTLARVGGDEFILMTMEANHMEDAAALAQKILDSFAEPLLIDDHQLYLSTRIGIAIYPEDAKDLETLAKKSDASMYYSKGHGRNQFKFFSDGDVWVGGNRASITRTKNQAQTGYTAPH